MSEQHDGEKHPIGGCHCSHVSSCRVRDSTRKMQPESQTILTKSTPSHHIRKKEKILKKLVWCIEARGIEPRTVYINYLGGIWGINHYVISPRRTHKGGHHLPKDMICCDSRICLHYTFLNTPGVKLSCLEAHQRSAYSRGVMDRGAQLTELLVHTVVVHQDLFLVSGAQVELYI